ncbi:hypothetical protein CR513_34214, partial [Mucuna pruriens]
MRCHNCQKLGHYARECWAKKVPKTNLTIVHTWHKMKGQIQTLKLSTKDTDRRRRKRRRTYNCTNLQQSFYCKKTIIVKGSRAIPGFDSQLKKIIDLLYTYCRREVTESYEGGDQFYIEKNQTWELVDPPSNKKPITLKYVYKVKVNPKGEVVKHKAKLVAKGIDYDEVYAPVAKIETVRLVVAIANNANWSMHQLDVKFSFLNGPLEEEVYVNQPQGFVVKGKENKVYKLKKALRIDDYLSQIGFRKCTSKHGVYVKCWKGSMKSKKLLVCLYVDDLLIIDKSEVEIGF